MTAQRLAICNWLYESESHPTANDVYDALREQFPTMSRATVYNTLSKLEALDLIHEVARGEDGSVRYDANTANHVNLLCRRCQRIFDIAEVDLEGIHRLAAAQGFQLDDINLVVHGLCADCQAELANAIKET